MVYYDINEIKAAARNRWPFILSSAGLSTNFLTGKAGPCPFCKAGNDRWTFYDKEGSGSGFCRRCNAKGDGFTILALALGLDSKKDFPKLLEYVAQSVGIAVRGAKR